MGVKKMELKLNDSEIITILNLCDEELSQDVVDPVMKTTLKHLIEKINGQVQFKHHNGIDEYTCAILNASYFVEAED